MREPHCVTDCGFDAHLSWDWLTDARAKPCVNDFQNLLCKLLCHFHNVFLSVFDVAYM